MAKQIFAAEVSFENVPLPIRKRLAHTDDQIKNTINMLRCRMDEVFILSTANRFAIYAVGDSIDPLVQFYLKDPEIFPFAQLYRSTEASVHHLFATASGLCSRIKGEHDIITPIKHARQVALACNSVGLVLDNLLREAVRVGRYVRSETGIDKFCSSVVDSGFSLLYNRFDNLHNKKFLIIGTDRIARLTLEHLGEEGIQNVSIFNADQMRGEELAAQYNVHFVQPDEVGFHFMTADVIVVGTNLSISLEPRFFDDSWIRHIVELDIDKRRIILDFGMPHDTQDTPASGDDMALEIYTLDDLQILVPQKLHPFGEIVDTAWRIISAEADDFLDILQQLEIAPLLTAYWSRLPMKDEQLDWLLPRIERPTRKDIEEIRRYAYGLAWNASRDPLKNMLRYVSDRQVKATQEAMRSLDSFASIKLNLSEN
jgi:glutamyl-tRNA reductase